MLKTFEDNTIHLTRGDTARLEVPLDNEQGEIYVMAEGDTLTLRMKKKLSDAEPCLTKESKGENLFHFEPDDTKHLPFGLYVYNVRIITAKGEEYTVVEPTTFKICEVV